jgi:general secretion pathway protein B
MSSILKALKKLEEEKARREGGGGDLARDILRGAQRRRGLRGWWLLPIGLIGGGLAVFAVLGQLSQTPNQGGRPTSPASARAYLNEKAPPTTLTESPGTVADGADREHAAPEPDPAVQPAAGQDARRQPPEDRMASVQSRPIADEPQAASARDAADPVAEEAPGNDLAADATAGREPTGDLVLSGIALQDGNATGMAIINGLPVMEGTVIEGARVEAVLPDRVRLKRDGEVFELLLRP